MYGYIYKTTNCLNNKIYIGKHSTQIFDEQYLGSGIVLNRAVKKYGRSNFIVEIIDVADTLEELNNKEIYWINNHFEKGFQLYNIAKGGNGGNTLFAMSDEDKLNRSIKLSTILQGHKLDTLTKQKISLSHKNNWLSEDYREKRKISTKKRLENSNFSKSQSKSINEYHRNRSTEDDERWSSVAIKRCKDEEYKRKQHETRKTDEYKQKMTNVLLGKTKGYVTLNNGLTHKRVPPDKVQSLVEQGWMYGRIPFSDEHKQRISEGKKKSSLKVGELS